MAEKFNPDAYLAKNASAGFDPDAYLAQSAPTERRGFQEQDESLWGGIEQGASGILQGTGDELKAVVAAIKESTSPGGLDFGNAYDQAKSVYQSARERYTQKNPVAAPVIDAVAQTLPWLAATPLLPFAPAAGVVPKLKYGAGMGGATGAVSGFTNTEGDLADRATGAVVSGLFGTVLGAASGPIIDLATKGGKGLIGALTNRLPFKQRGIAERKIAEALHRDGYTPETALAKLREMGPGARIIDLGENVRDLGGTAVQTPGRGKTALTRALTRRQEGARGVDKVLKGGQANRIANMLDEVAPEDFYKTRAGLERERKSMGRGYDAARDGGDLVDTSSVIAKLDDDILSAKGGVKSSLRRIRSYLTDDKGHPEVTIETLHNSKIAIDDLMSGAAKTSMGRVSKAKVWEVERGLVDAIEASGESGARYNASRLGTASSWSRQEAMEQGVKFLRKSEFTNPDELGIALKDMSQEQLHSFRIGVVQQLKNMAGDSKVRADTTKQMMGVNNLEKKIAMAFGDKEMFVKYITALENEGAKFKSYSKMFGSQTSKNQAAMDDARIDPSRFLGGLRQMASTNPLDWARGAFNTVGGAKDRITMPEGVSSQLARSLLGKNLNAINKPYQSAINGKAVQNRLAEALAIGSGSQAGSNYGKYTRGQR